MSDDAKHAPAAVCYFQGRTVKTVVSEATEYGPSVARLFVLTDDPHLAERIREAQGRGAKFYLQVKAAHGEGGDPINASHPCPGSPGCP